MEGKYILDTINASRAPVYVVVKSLAASMAAIIVTLAEHSYASPDAVLIHHQVSGLASGNITQIKEQQNQIQMWEKKFLSPLAKKLRYKNIEDFRKDLYRHNSNGDWSQFAVDSHKKHWVKNIAFNIIDEGVSRHPDDIDCSVNKPINEVTEAIRLEKDGGKVFARLPSLRPCDGYFLYDQQGYYKF